MQNTKLIIISGPSGTGKTAIIDELLHKYSNELNLTFSISYTTRKKRDHEIDKKDYFFIFEKIFKKMIENNEFYEYVKYAGNYYGTSKEYILNQLNNGKNVLLDIELIGAEKIIRNMKNVISFFIIPNDFNDLSERIKERQENISKEEFLERIEASKQQTKIVEQKQQYNYIVCNKKNHLDETIANIYLKLKANLKK